MPTVFSKFSRFHFYDFVEQLIRFRPESFEQQNDEDEIDLDNDGKRKRSCFKLDTPIDYLNLCVKT